MARVKTRLKSAFTLGGEQAEADPLLEDAFYESSDYQVLVSRTDKRCFVIGRTGAGKSAALQRLEETQAAHVIRINPEDLSLPYITDLGVIKQLDQLDVNLDLFWTSLWRHVLLVEVIKHRYKIDSPEAKQNFLADLKSKISRDPAKRAALDYVNEFEGRFWCETDERVREITKEFTRKIDAEIKASAGGVGVGSSNGIGFTESQKIQQADRFQRVINETQLAKLNKMLAVLDEEVLDSPQHFTYIVIDDLDRDWVDERLANDLIRCLFKTILDMKRIRHLKILVALRTNIFQELDFGRRGGGQEEKFRALVLPLRWTRYDLMALLDERVRVAGARVDYQLGGISELLPNSNRARGNPVDYVLDRTLLRPRDAIAFVNACLDVGIGKTRLTWSDITSAERGYSANRLLALRDEWKTTYPGIDQVFQLFRGVDAKIGKAEFEAILGDVMILVSDEKFPGVTWLNPLCDAMWSSACHENSWFELYQPLARLLYSLGFIGASTRSTASPTFVNLDPLLFDSESNLDKCEFFYVHRTYQMALDVRSSALSSSLAVGV